MSARPVIIEDPDLVQAIEDLRPVYAEWRAIAVRLRKLSKTLDAAADAAMRAQIADLRGRIVTRAEKLALNGDGIIGILRVEFEERARLRRKPSRRQLTKALRAERKFLAERLAEAEEDQRRASEILKKRRTAYLAGESACLLYTGFGS